MGQKNSNQSDEGDAPTSNDVTSKGGSDGLQLTNNERLIIRNFRAMKRSVQLTFVDLSEELALALPATRPGSAPAPARGY